MKKKTIWIICFNHLHKDPRAYRQIQWLAPDYDIVTFGFSPSGIASVRHIPIDPPSLPRPWYNPLKWTSKARTAISLCSQNFEAFYWSCPFHKNALKTISHLNEVPDLVIANDVDTLPLAIKAASGRKIIADLHEYAPKEAEDIWKWRVFFQPYIHYLCTKYLPKFHALFTVCQGISDEYSKIYGVKPRVLTNAPPFHDLLPTLIQNNKIRMIHHGIAIPSRQMEEMIQLMNHLDNRFFLDFMLVPGDPLYIKKLINMAKKNRNIRFLHPQPMQELCRFTNQYDVGLFYLPPTNFNYLHALPNKFFEFIQARLAVAIGPSPEMSHYVKNFDCGIIGETFNPTDLANKLYELTPEKLMHYKQRSHEAAKILNAENNRRIFVDTVNELLQ